MGYLVASFGSPPPKLLDTVLPIVDAVLRTGGVCYTVNLVHSHPNPAVSSSLFLQLLLGGVASAGGGAAASTLGVWETQWSLRTPPFLRGGLLDTLDIWGGSIVAAVYGCLLGLHPAYEPYTRWLSGEGKAYEAGTPLMSPIEARSVSVFVLGALFAYRAYVTHYVAIKRPAPVQVKLVEKEKDL